MDGLLIDSEPLWRAVEIRELSRLGVPLTEEMCRQTMGLRVNEVVAHWYRQYPWGPPPSSVEQILIDGVIAAIRRQGRAMPGARAAIEFMAARGLRLAIASSSYYSVIDAVLEVLDARDAFAVIHSAQDEERGKPDPAVYLSAAAKLGIDPRACIALEDSPNGVRSAQAAGMACIAVPEAGVDPSAIGADIVLSSLAELDDAVITALTERSR